MNLFYHGRTMTNKMMALMSLRGRSGKVSFMKTHLYKLICGEFSLTFFNNVLNNIEYSKQNNNS